MRTCVIGGGLAGVTLAWRLAHEPGGAVDLLTGGATSGTGTDSAAPAGEDATAVSAGAVRAYEPDPLARRLAIDSLCELLDSAVLRRWSGYHECGFTYLRRTDAAPAATIAAAVTELEQALPGSTRVLTAGELPAHGWRGLDPDTPAVAVVERRAGHVAPDRLRRALLDELCAVRQVTVRPECVASVWPLLTGRVRIRLVGGGPDAEYDRVVIAAGAWTAGLLRACNLRVEGVRTKTIQYAVHDAGSWCPATGFVDETTGLYGRATHTGGLLLGLPSDRWDVPAGRQRLDRDLRERAATQARRTFPDLRLGRSRTWVSVADCYTDPPMLALRPVPGAPGILTFTGGSGGSIKTMLAASARAAGQLAGRPDPLHVHAFPTSQPTPNPDRATRPQSAQRSDLMSDPVTARDEVPHFHTVGVGAGPANLSLAALFHSATSESIALFDRQAGPAWHPALLYPGVRMQTGWLKDLVSLVDPTHELTFLNYLVSTGRLYALLNAQFDAIPRIEYERYLCWAARRLPHVRYGVTVDQVSYLDGTFAVSAQGRTIAHADHLVVGVGTRPYVPAELAGLPAERAFLADDLPERLASAGAADRAAPVAVVGSGQTGLEAVFRLLGMGFTDISWIGRHQWFQTIDDSPVANDVYRPAHLAYLQRLSRPTRRRLIAGHRTTGDALTPGGLKALYQANYDGLLELGRFPVTLLPGRDVVAGEAAGEDVVLQCATVEGREEHRYRYLVIAAGREHVPPPFDDDLRERIDVDDEQEMIVEADFSVRWKGMNGNRIFALNHSRYSHGLTNAGLTLLPVRAAMVLNSLFGREIYKVDDELCPVRW